MARPTKEIGLEVNAGNSNYTLLSRHENAGQNHDMKTGNRCFEIMAHLKNLGTIIRDLRDQNLTQEKIKRRLTAGNACYHSLQNLTSSRLLSKNIQIRILIIIILPVVLYGCATRSLALREEHRLGCFIPGC
jgi:hypothetical protein